MNTHNCEYTYILVATGSKYDISNTKWSKRKEKNKLKPDIGHLETVDLVIFHSLLIMMIKAESYKIFSEIYCPIVPAPLELLFGDGYRSEMSAGFLRVRTL